MAHDLFSFDPSVLLVRDTAGDYRPAQADEVLQAAQRILRQQLGDRVLFDSPQAVREFLKVKLGALEHEVFAVLMLDSQNRLIEYVELFRGTVSQTSVYPREVVKECMARNAAALVLVHNHPSGDPTPSDADISMTHQVQEAAQVLGLVLHDHLIVGKSREISFRAAGYL